MEREITFRFGFPGYGTHTRRAVNQMPPDTGYDSTASVGFSSGHAAGLNPERVDGRFRKGNPYRWKRGQSGNPRGRRRKVNNAVLYGTVLDLRASLHDLERRIRPTRDSRFEKFKVLYELTGNAYQSALLAGYAPKTAKSKAYLLARRAAFA